MNILKYINSNIDFNKISFLKKIKYSFIQFASIFTLTLLIASFLSEVNSLYIWNISTGLLTIIFIAQYIPLIVNWMFKQK
jgi:hypothetical protein